MLDPETCYLALKARDPRFDGRLFVGITSTGIYCRPVCPAPSARFANCRFFASAAAAQAAGFRPCLRCRPEVVAELGSWLGTSNTVSRALALISQGELDGEEGLEDFAERLGVGARQLRRLFHHHLGASPVAVAQTRRVLFAKQLLHETQLPMTQVALAAGFGSVRRFNEVFQRLFRRPPSALRRTKQRSTTGVTVRLRYREPYDWDAMRAYLAARAIDGVERLDARSYARTALHEGEPGVIEVEHLPAAESLSVTLRLPGVRSLAALVGRVRRVFDLDADVKSIGAHLARDPLLARLISARPGLRTPGAWDGFELAMRAILGQQVSVEAGRQLAGKLVQACGAQVRDTGDPALTRRFPAAAEVVKADLSSLGMPRARKAALVSMARAALANATLFEPLATVELTVERLRAIPGVGDWTAQYIALRASREPDAFPSTDVALLRGASRKGVRPTSAQLLQRAERWRPWRAYAAQHLWAAASS